MWAHWGCSPSWWRRLGGRSVRIWLHGNHNREAEREILVSVNLNFSLKIFYGSTYVCILNRVCVSRSEDNFWGLVPCCYHVGSGIRFQFSGLYASTAIHWAISQAHVLLSIQPQTQVHGMVPPTFRVSPPTSANLIWITPHRCEKRCLLGGPRLYQGNNSNPLGSWMRSTVDTSTAVGDLYSLYIDYSSLYNWLTRQSTKHRKP